MDTVMMKQILKNVFMMAETVVYQMLPFWLMLLVVGAILKAPVQNALKETALYGVMGIVNGRVENVS